MRSLLEGEGLKIEDVVVHQELTFELGLSSQSLRLEVIVCHLLKESGGSEVKYLVSTHYSADSEC